MTFYAVQSGAFNDVETWATGVIPSGDCLIIIPLETVVTFTGSIFDFNLRTMLVYGTLSIISTESDGFTFSHSVNLVIGSMGIFDLQISSNRINFVVGSVLNFFSGATFTGANTEVYAYSTSIDEAVVISTMTLSSSLQGPLTYDILTNLTAATYSQITFIARSSGSFSDLTVWPGLYRPSTAFCTSAGGCGIYIGSGFNISTASLNGTMAAKISKITIASEGVFQLGTPSSTTGFLFRFPVEIDCSGTLQDVTGQNGGLIVPISSKINFSDSASFVSEVSTFLKSYNTNDVSTIIDSETWNSPLDIPSFYEVTSDGTILLALP